MKKSISIGLFAVGFLVIIRFLIPSHKSSGLHIESNQPMIDDVNDFPIGI
ncbi:MAG: hypothetical protein WCT99_05205 [Bacteroidota bacterium]|jgi:hypothetical protein